MHSIFINLEAANSKKGILEVLMPKTAENFEVKPLGNKTENSCAANLPLCGSFQGNCSKLNSDIKPSGNEGEGMVMEKSDYMSYEMYCNSWAALDVFTSKEYLASKDYMSYDTPEIQKLKESVQLLLSSFNHLNQDELQKDDKGLFEEANFMLDELKQLSELLSDKEIVLKMSLIVKLSARLRERRPKLMAFLYPHITKKDAGSRIETLDCVASRQGQGDKGKTKKVIKQCNRKLSKGKKKKR